MKSGTVRDKLTRLLVIVSVCIASLPGKAQNYVLKVRITDSLFLPVESATIKINQLETITDSGGMKSIQLPSGKYRMAISSVGYQSTILNMLLTADTLIGIILTPRQSLLSNVVVSASKHIHRNQMGIQALTIEQIKKLPVILGEIDPIKTLTLLPGIKNGGEASSGIYVRGGGPDQNLILMDGMPVYNPNHLLGFFSIFNGDAVKNMEVIKGSMPAEYGGRLSSVVSIDTREGNKDTIKGSGGIGLISSRGSIEGPVVKGKSAFNISARRTYIDQLAKAFAPDSLKGNSYYFYDINAKLDYDINKNNKIYFTFYRGKDKFAYVDNDKDSPERHFNADWGNTLAGLTWEQQIGKKIKQKLAVIYNDFNLDSRAVYGSNIVIFSSGLTDKQVKNDWTFTLNNYIRFKAGAQYIIHTFRPGAGSSSAGIQEFKANITDQHAREAAAYVSTDINLTTQLNIIAGLRYSYFNQIGPMERVVYDPDGSPSGESEIYGKGQSIAKYTNPEPRFSLLYRLPGLASIKLSYTQSAQYLHLATTSAATFPGDIWVPSGKQVKPGLARQIAAGFFKSIHNGMYELNVETYYKTMDNQIEFKPGARLLLNQNLEGEMIFGSGKAYGVELFFQKKTGRLTGWIGYTLSRAERTFPDMNNGQPFPYRYDRTHDASVVATYKLSKKWETSAVFVYGTGNALTMPTGRFIYNVGFNRTTQQPIYTSINQYDKINDYRMPAYHRMDIAFTYIPNPDKKRRFKSSWNFSVYNVYNRHNPYFIYFDVDDDTQTAKGKMVYLFPVLPSVTWNFKF